MPHPSEHALDRPALLAALRARSGNAVRAGGTAHGHTARSLPLCEAIDQRLPGGGLLRSAMHEVLAADPAAAAGFCAMLLARAGGTVLWIAPNADVGPPGLARFGLSPADLVLVRARHATDGLWAMEESLRSPGIAGALLVSAEPDPDTTRRLQLAAEAGGAIGLLLCPDSEAAGASTALTRWRVGALAGGGGTTQDLGDPRWQLDLLHCRGGRPQSWQVAWRPAAERLDLDSAEQPERDITAPPIRATRRRIR